MPEKQADPASPVLLRQAFVAGAQAALRGLARTQCPHPASSDRRKPWMAGWFLVIDQVMPHAPYEGVSRG
jgi:ribosome modulation factor